MPSRGLPPVLIEGEKILRMQLFDPACLKIRRTFEKVVVYMDLFIALWLHACRNTTGGTHKLF